MMFLKSTIIFVFLSTCLALGFGFKGYEHPDWVKREIEEVVLTENYGQLVLYKATILYSEVFMDNY